MNEETDRLLVDGKAALAESFAMYRERLERMIEFRAMIASVVAFIARVCCRKPISRWVPSQARSNPAQAVTKQKNPGKTRVVMAGEGASGTNEYTQMDSNH